MTSHPDPLAPLRPLGAVLNPDLVQATYRVIAPLAAALDPATTAARYDIAYGPHPRNRLDLYRPAGDAPVETVVLFVHGGGFAGGDKGGEGKPFFANIGQWAASEGFAAVAMTYRLLPDAKWPSGAQDVAAAIAHISENAETLFGTSPRIVLAGQSAGAINVADYLAGRAGPVHAAVAGAVLMSGLYDFTRHDRRTFEDAYFGEAPAQFAAHSTLAALASCPLPLMFTVAELDPPHFQRQAAHLVEIWMAENGAWPLMHYMPGHNHISPAPLIGSAVDTLGPVIARFVREVVAET